MVNTTVHTICLLSIETTGRRKTISEQSHRWKQRPTLNSATEERRAQWWPRGGIGRALDDHLLFSPGCLQTCTRCWRCREAEQREGTLEQTDGEQSWQDSAGHKTSVGHKTSAGTQKIVHYTKPVQDTKQHITKNNSAQLKTTVHITKTVIDTKNGTGHKQ